jgi:hypothetical protein
MTVQDAAALALTVQHPDLADGSSRFTDGEGPSAATTAVLSLGGQEVPMLPPHPRRSRTYRGALVGDEAYEPSEQTDGS